MNVRIAAMLLVGMVASSQGYAKKYPLAATAVVPAARGKIETGKDKNGNTKLKLEAEHLAEPGKLSPPKTAYVVWLQEKNAAPETQGQLRVDKNLKGTFETTTPLKSFDVFVTAESDPASKQPNGTEVFRVTVQD
jgi:hypothetical protein